jgi:hypothetical protein
MRGEICVGSASILSYVLFLNYMFTKSMKRSHSIRLAATLVMIFVHVSAVANCRFLNLIQFANQVGQINTSTVPRSISMVL